MPTLEEALKELTSAVSLLKDMTALEPGLSSEATTERSIEVDSGLSEDETTDRRLDIMPSGFRDGESENAEEKPGIIESSELRNDSSSELNLKSQLVTGQNEKNRDPEIEEIKDEIGKPINMKVVKDGTSVSDISEGSKTANAVKVKEDETSIIDGIEDIIAVNGELEDEKPAFDGTPEEDGS